MGPRRRVSRTVLALGLAAGAWIPSAHLALRPARAEVIAPSTAVAPMAEALLAQQLAAWRAEADTARMRASCAEWDFMRRTFLVLSLANVALRDPSRRDALVPVMDAILDDTLARERAHGQSHFLLPYANARPWVQQPARSVFVDGEVALMLGARRMIRDDGRWDAEHRARVRVIAARMETSPTRSAESYPDECWTFCNTVALAALRVWDALSGEDHRPLARAWLAVARARLTDARTGMLVSSYRLDGAVGDGPEASSLFMAAHALQLVDADLARAQYRLARESLGRSAMGFGWAREWPAATRARDDVDSAPTVPLVEANAGASGMAILGAAAFGDEDYLRALLTSVRLAAFPVRDAGRLRLAAGNAVGDAVLLYALVQGPLWRAVEARR